MDIKATNVFTRNRLATTRLVINRGGSRSSKTFSLMQLAYLLALTNHNILISVVSESMPHLYRGAMADFLKFLKDNNLYHKSLHHESKNYYTVGTSRIEFFSCDSYEKVHGPSRDYLFINEIQNIKFETFFHIMQRTNIRVYADYNPTHEFWIDTEFLQNEQYKSDITHIQSTIFDNPFVSEHIKKDILLRAERDPNYKRVYLEGLPGTLEGLVFNNWSIIDSIPIDAKTFYYGMDWGFSHSPTTLIKVHIQNDNIYIDELIYETGLLNDAVIAMLKQHKLMYSDLIIADSEDSKSIAEIKNKGFNIIPCLAKKAIMFGIDLLQQKNIFITKRSTNVINEFRNYRYATDKNGKNLNIPLKMFDHAIDPLRYVLDYHNNRKPFAPYKIRVGHN